MPKSKVHMILFSDQICHGKKCATLWLWFQAFSRNDEHFWKPFGSLKNIFGLNLFDFHLVLGFRQSPFQISFEFKHDAATKLVQGQGKARDVTTHPH